MAASETAMSEQAHPNLIRVARYYDTMRGGRQMPHRSLFRPIDLHWLFGQFYAIEALRDGDYRYGFCGPLWALMYGTDRTGKRLSELEACGQAAGLRAMYDAVCASHRSALGNCRLVWRGGQVCQHQRILIPFAGDDNAPALLLVVAQCGDDLASALRKKGHGEPTLEIDSLTDFETGQSPTHNINSARLSA